MLINFSQELKDLAGNTVKDGETIITLGVVVANTLVMPKQEQRKDPAKCYVIAMKVFGGGEHEIDQIDLELIKQEIKTSSYWPLLVGQALLLLW